MVRLIDVDSGQVKQAWALKPTVLVTRAEFVPGPVSKFVAGTHDGSALVWIDTWDETELRFAKQEGMLTDLAVSHDGSHVASCYNLIREGKAGTGTVVLWNLKTGELLQKATVEERSIYSVRFAPDGRYLAYTIEFVVTFHNGTKWQSKFIGRSAPGAPPGVVADAMANVAERTGNPIIPVNFIEDVPQP